MWYIMSCCFIFYQKYTIIWFSHNFVIQFLYNFACISEIRFPLNAKHSYCRFSSFSQQYQTQPHLDNSRRSVLWKTLMFASPVCQLLEKQLFLLKNNPCLFHQTLLFIRCFVMGKRFNFSSQYLIPSYKYKCKTNTVMCS